MKTQRLTFKGASGAQLSGRLEMPVGEPIAYALFAHCFTCSKNYRAVVNISRALARSGISVLRFDFTGLGESEGEFSETTFSSNIEDLVAAAEFLGTEWERPSILIGHSLGGAAVIRAAGRLPSVEAVVTINSPADPEQVKRHLRSSLAEIEESGYAEVSLAGRPFTIKREFLEDVSRQNMTRALEELEAALLVFHAPDDEVVDFENAERIFATARSSKTFVPLQGADHLLTRPEDSEYVGSVIGAWAARYLGTAETVAEPGEAKRPAEGEAVVRTGRAHYHTEILVGRHRLISDEPEETGGADTGPEPFGLLMSSLGACTTITVRMYADRKEWPLEEVGVRLTHRELAADGAKADGGYARIHEIGQRLELVGDLDAEQRERLLEIAHRCPVHRALEAGLSAPIELVESD
jgi:putative redox protein